MAATRGGVQKPKTGKGVFPPPGTPDVEGGLWDLFNLILSPLNAIGGMGGGETVAPKGGTPYNPDQMSEAYKTAPTSTTAMPGSVGQTPQMAAQPTDTVQAVPASDFSLESVFGPQFAGMSEGTPNPTRNPLAGGMNPPSPNPDRMLGMMLQGMMGQSAPPVPEPNPSFHNEDMLRQVFASFGG